MLHRIIFLGKGNIDNDYNVCPMLATGKNMKSTTKEYTGHA